jgi:hypothetical protein
MIALITGSVKPWTFAAWLHKVRGALRETKAKLVRQG